MNNARDDRQKRQDENDDQRNHPRIHILSVSGVVFGFCLLVGRCEKKNQRNRSSRWLLRDWTETPAAGGAHCTVTARACGLHSHRDQLPGQLLYIWILSKVAVSKLPGRTASVWPNLVRKKKKFRKNLDCIFLLVVISIIFNKRSTKLGERRDTRNGKKHKGESERDSHIFLT